ncbi:MAG: hypothetical protein HQ567_20085 [Candidatus Nealsonbacteria bacterium]|nr:hypothetical protein [Candidatus Nealsonbacteria bacterium]
MPIRSFACFLALWLVFPSGRATAASAEKPKLAPEISVRQLRGGRTTLRIKYPWKAYTQPSIEVRLVTSRKADAGDVRPLLFVGNFMKGELKVKIYRATDDAATGTVILPITEKELDMDILGGRNALGKPAICIARQVPEDDPARGAGAVFPQLSSWALDDHTLYLNLPGKATAPVLGAAKTYFAPAGKLHVWFLRGNEVVWREEIEWKGMGAGK